MQGDPIKATTIEKTSKKYKGMFLLSCIICFVGMIIIGTSPFLGGILFLIGASLLIYSAIGSWWNNG